MARFAHAETIPVLSRKLGTEHAQGSSQSLVFEVCGRFIRHGAASLPVGALHFSALVSLERHEFRQASLVNGDAEELVVAPAGRARPRLIEF